MNREAFKELLFHGIPQTEGKRLVVWGAGNTAQLYAEGLERLEKEGFFIHAYCDNDPKKYRGGKMQRQRNNFSLPIKEYGKCLCPDMLPQTRCHQRRKRTGNRDEAGMLSAGRSDSEAARRKALGML